MRRAERWVVVVAALLVVACGEQPRGRGDVAIVEPPWLTRGPPASPPPDVTALVTWPDGAPAAGVNVGLHDGRASDRWGMTDVDGRVAWDDVPLGVVHVTADRARGGTVDRVTDRPVEVTIELRGGTDVSGTVVDASDDRVAGAEVHYLSQFADRPLRIATTDARGEFSARHVARGFLVARAPGHGPSDVGFVKEQVPLALAPEARAVGGRVVARDGSPVPDAEVRLRRVSPFALSRKSLPGPGATTDDQGRFTIDGLPATDLRVVVHAAGFAPLEGEVDTRAGDVTGHLVMLDRGWTVRGTVTDGAGVPVVGASVTWAGSPGGASSRTDADGAYALEDLPVAWHTSGEPVRVTHGDFIDTTSDAHASFVPGRDVTWSPELVVGGVIRGVVFDEYGRPFDGAGVRLTSYEPDSSAFATRTSAPDGVFVFRGLAPGAYEVVASTDDGPRRTRAVTARPGEEVRLALFIDDPWRIVGRVAPPGPWVEVALLDRVGDLVARRGLERDEGGEGAFEFVGVQPGVYALEFKRASPSSYTAPYAVTIAPGETVDVGVVDVSQLVGRVVVRLTSTNGGPLDGARVELARREGVLGAASRPLRRGPGRRVHSVDDVMPGRHDIVVDGPGLVRRVEPVHVVAGVSTDLTLDVAAGVPTTLRAGWLADTRGPSPRAEIVVRDAFGRLAFSKVDEVHRLTLSLVVDLAPGAYTVEITDERLRRGAAAFDVAAPSADVSVTVR